MCRCVCGGGGGGISVGENVLLVILSGIGSLHRVGHSVA